LGDGRRANNPARLKNNILLRNPMKYAGRFSGNDLGNEIRLVI
jgi:hypothetical protein